MSAEEVKAFSARLHEEFQARSGEFLTPIEDEETPDSGVLTAWFLVTEWAGADGEHWLSYHHAPKQAPWRARGILSEAVSDLP